MKNQKGITLIALIITIIVMLILVGVSVTVALNGGLFSTAKQAAEGTKVEGERERLLSIALGTLDNKGRVDPDKLEEALEGTEFRLNDDGTITSTKTGKTFVVSERGSIAFKWTHEDSNSNGTLDLGELVTASNGESFYVIETPVANATEVKLLAKDCIVVDETNPDYLKQSANPGEVMFYDSSEEEYWDTNEGSNIQESDPVYSNHYAAYLADEYGRGLGVKGRLMFLSEAESLKGSSETKVILYGNDAEKLNSDNLDSAKHLNYWLGTTIIGMGDYAAPATVYSFLDEEIITGPEVNQGIARVNDVDSDTYGVRPIVEVPLSEIS